MGDGANLTRRSGPVLVAFWAGAHGEWPAMIGGRPAMGKFRTAMVRGRNLMIIQKRLDEIGHRDPGEATCRTTHRPLLPLPAGGSEVASGWFKTSHDRSGTSRGCFATTHWHVQNLPRQAWNLPWPVQDLPRQVQNLPLLVRNHPLARPKPPAVGPEPPAAASGPPTG